MRKQTQKASGHLLWLVVCKRCRLFLIQLEHGGFNSKWHPVLYSKIKCEEKSELIACQDHILRA